MYRRGSSKSREAIVQIRGDDDFLEITRRLYTVYYRLHPSIEEPPEIEKREFAFQPFDIDSYVRHISFSSYKELQDYLAASPPRHAYYSVAKYELPEAKSMEEKNFLGAWLLFDLDLDHVPECNEYAVSVPSGDKLLDDKCLLEGLRLMLKLRRMVRRDLNPESDIIYYTGHRGFHMRVICGECETLGREARKQLARYFAGEGVDVYKLFPSSLVIKRGRRKIRVDPAVPRPEDPGWRGWIALELAPRLNRARSLVEALGASWETVVAEAISEAVVPIDMMVTQDPSRLTRLFCSINWKGHFLVSPVSRGWRPSLRLSPFSGEVHVRFNVDLDQLTLMGTRLASRKGEEQEIPAGLALHLAAKGAVEILGGDIVVRAGSCGRPI